MQRALPDSADPLPERPLARCPACGVRVDGHGPGCPRHGPISRRGPASALEEDRPSDAWGPLPLVPGVRATQWLGRGGFGVVFAGKRERDGAEVAVKVALSSVPDAKARLTREIQALRKIGPPAVPAVSGEGTLPSGAPYVIMERMRAPSLAARLTREAGPIPLARAAPWLLGLLDAVHEVHARGFVHADLKPENVFVEDDGRATLIDFSLVVSTSFPTAPATPSPTDEAADEPPETMASGTHVIGTSEYMAPEQCAGRAGIDRRTDIYALGVIACEVLTGRPPFLGASDAVRQSHMNHRPRRPSAFADVPPAVDDVLLRCLEKRPEDRFQTVAALRAALERACLSAESFTPAAPRPNKADAPPATTGTSAARTRIRAALVFFEADEAAPTVEHTLRALGAELASAQGARMVALFTHEADENPARAALAGARELQRRGICRKARLDLATVTAQTRPNGLRRYVSPLFAQAARFPAEGDPEGTTLSPAFAEVLPPSDTGALGLDDASSPSMPSQADDASTVSDTGTSLPLFGRKELLEHLVAGALEATRARAPRVTRVLGGEGIGKTRLFAALTQRLRAEAKPARVLSLSARTSVTGEGAVARLLRSASALPADPPPDGGRAFLGAALAGTGHAAAWPALSLALGWLDVDAPEVHAIAVAPSALASSTAMAAGALLRRAANEAPLLVLVDDAHLADEITLTALEMATLAEAGAAMAVVAFGRPAFAEARPVWGERAAKTETHTLEPLDEESAAGLCRTLLEPATDVPEAAVSRIVARAGAIPMLLVELVRGLRREGIIRPRPGGNSHYLATDEMDRLPDLPIVTWIAERETSTLAPALSAHARLCAALADEVSVRDVKGVLVELDRAGEADAFPLDARAGVERLISLGILSGSSRSVVRFRRALVRESIVRSIPEATLRSIHRAALAYYRKGSHGLPEDALLRRLASHAASAGERAFAELCYLSLGERDASRQRYLDAEIHYSRALELSAAPTFGAYRSRGAMRCRLGRHRDGIVDFQAARTLAAARSEPLASAELLLDEAEAHDWVDDYGASALCVEQAEALAGNEGSPLLAARLLLGRGRALHRRSLEREAAEVLTRALAAAERLGDEAYETRIISLLMLGFVLQGLGELARAASHLDRAIRLCEEHGDLLHLGPALSNRALLCALSGDAPGMVAGYGRVATLARELGQPLLELVTEFNLGEYLHLLGDLDAAELHVRRAIAIEERRSGAAMLPSVELLGARLAGCQGLSERAATITRSIRARQAKAKDEGGGEAFLSPSDDVLCTMIELTTGGGSEEAWDALEERSERYSVGQERIEVAEWRGLAALAEGRIEEARSAFARALVLCDRIPNCMRARIEARIVGVR